MYGKEIVLKIKKVIILPWAHSDLPGDRNNARLDWLVYVFIRSGLPLSSLKWIIIVFKIIPKYLGDKNTSFERKRPHVLDSERNKYRLYEFLLSVTNF